MIKLRAIFKDNGKETKPINITVKDGKPVGWMSAKARYMFEKTSILMLGVQIGDEWHFENDVYLYQHDDSYYVLQGNIGGWILRGINRMVPMNIGHIPGLKKIGHLWTWDEKIRQLVKEYDPPVYSCLENIGRFSEVMR